ncbi:hypothetical protein D3C80_1609020 [compost metagenome]
MVPVVSSRFDFMDPNMARIIGNKAKAATSSRKIHSRTRDSTALVLTLLAGAEASFVSA